MRNSSTEVVQVCLFFPLGAISVSGANLEPEYFFIKICFNLEIPNNFESEQECNNYCKVVKEAHFGHHHTELEEIEKSASANPPKCLSPTYDFYIEMGSITCDNYQSKFQFNFESGLCEGFRWGGCLDIDNMFDDMARCIAECSPYTLPPTTTTTTTTTTTSTTTTTQRPLPSQQRDNSATTLSTTSYGLILLTGASTLLHFC